MKKIICGLVVIVFVQLGLVTTYAKEVTIYYEKYNEKYDLNYFVSQTVEVGEIETVEQLCYKTFEMFFCTDAEYITKNVKVNKCIVLDGELIIDVSDDILKSAGTYKELIMVEQIVKNATKIDGVQSVTLTIDGKLQPFVEGSVIYKQND